MIRDELQKMSDWMCSPAGKRLIERWMWIVLLASISIVTYLIATSPR